MCFQTNQVKPWHDWNWDGDEIIHRPIVPASRPIPGSRKKEKYPIDIREYLTTAKNAVVAERLGKIIDELPQANQRLFRDKSRGSFDFRVDVILESFKDLRHLVQANVTRRRADAWLYPDETLAQGGGDCEDLAFLLAALLLAAGISDYCVRVALGSLRITLPGGKLQKHDHCWVMYQNEGSVWEILEPLSRVRGRSQKTSTTAAGAPRVEYIPHYVFNSAHLWSIHSPELRKGLGFEGYLHQRRFWQKFDPSFAMGVHNGIYDDALGGKIPAAAISAIKRKSLLLDANIFTYDPRDHFDNGYIEAGWARVQQRLAAFRKDNTDWASFGAAAHAIGDFYAHTSYVHFARLQNAASDKGQAVIHGTPDGFVQSPEYTATLADPSLPPFDLTSPDFSINNQLWKGDKSEVPGLWKGEIISGRYAQKYDPKAGFFEGFTGMPTELAGAADYKLRGSLPHHNEIAVDDQAKPSSHKLYRAKATGPEDRRAFANQFRWRRNAAVAHIRQALKDNYQAD